MTIELMALGRIAALLAGCDTPTISVPPKAKDTLGQEL